MDGTVNPKWKIILLKLVLVGIMVVAARLIGIIDWPWWIVVTFPLWIVVVATLWAFIVIFGAEVGSRVR